nr:MAG TPA: hypothetical protein [Caudoviricetes sp.]
MLQVRVQPRWLNLLSRLTERQRSLILLLLNIRTRR